MEVDDNEAPMLPEEIVRILAAMQELRPLEIPDDVAADLDDWERKLNQHGIENAEKGIDDEFRRDAPSSTLESPGSISLLCVGLMTSHRGRFMFDPLRPRRRVPFVVSRPLLSRF